MEKIMTDGNTAAAMSAYAANEIAIIYPITPSSPMAEACDEWSGSGKTNMFGLPLRVIEMQSEAGVAGAVHGSLLTGSLTTTFTASQGLLLMIPNMYKIAGELLPCVFNVAARTLATHALSIFGDHSDVMACRQTGFAMLCSNNVQEAHDFATVAMMTTLKSRIPFLHFFDGFRTSHEISKIYALNMEEIKKLMPARDIAAFRSRALTPNKPKQHGTSQNPDVFFQNRECSQIFYNELLGFFNESLKEFEALTGRNYSPYEYVGPKNPTRVIVMMGSGAEVAEATLEALNAQEKSDKVGLIKIRLYRPFYAKEFCDAVPSSVETVTVLDRTKESGSVGEPLYTDVCAALAECGRNAKVLGGRYGLGGKDFTPAMVKAVFDNMNTTRKNHFTVGILDDLTDNSLDVPEFSPVNSGTECLFYGLGSDGTVSANKNSIKIIGDNTDLYAQGYFVYDSKKSGSVTISHLRFGKDPIRAPYNITKADFLACHNARFIGKYDFLENLKARGTLLLNCDWETDEELQRQLPGRFKRTIAQNKINFYTINAQKIADELGLKGKINTIMQSAFFKLANIIPYEEARTAMKEAAKKSYGKAGEKVVQSNYQAIDMGAESLRRINYGEDWMNAENTITTTVTENGNDFFQNIMKPIQELKGDSLPQSVFTPDGHIPTATSRFEKRGIAPTIPCWIKENCIQCNMCSVVCPHAAIRPVLIDKTTNKPASFDTVPAQGKENLEFRIQVSPLDCTGCGSCANVCPALKKALVMRDGAEQIEKEQDNYHFAHDHVNDPGEFDANTLKGSQFKPCLFEFNGACAGCGETPYIKMVTQLFGENMVIANATGCSSIYGGSYPACPYGLNHENKGPAWANSLFEDNAEFGLGMRLSIDSQQAQLTKMMQQAIELGSISAPAFEKWMKVKDDIQLSKDAARELIEAVTEELSAATGTLRTILRQILDARDNLTAKTVWIIGGDGWAYDIGYGGLDHILAGNEDVNILVLDSQVYSNTGGQASKATPCGTIAKFAEFGKKTSKKNLGLMALNYPNVYVAQIALGANMNQTLTAIKEAQAHKGPSLIIAYSTCINHGIDMSQSMLVERKAVQSGYWHLFRYLPETGELKIDSGEPTLDYIEFAKEERRFANLYKRNPEHAQQLMEQSKLDSERVLARLKKLAGK